jgi:hypothetical protein
MKWRPATVVALASVAVWATDCDPEAYPVDPTFCDDWCRVLLRSGCDQEPENCVRTCEQSRPPRECQELERELLRCYAATPPSEFVCSRQGFQEIARPEERICQTERDGLIDCAYPEVKLCLDVCRVIEARYAADADVDARPPSGRICPSYDIPCDSICWVARGYLVDARSDAARGASDASPFDSSASSPDAGTRLGELADKVIGCAIGRAEACRSGDADAGDAGNDGGAGRSNANWSSVLLECAGELGL